MNGAAEVATASDSNHTSNGSKKEENGELDLKLTNRQLELITQTWKLVDLEEAGMVMFLK